MKKSVWGAGGTLIRKGRVLWTQGEEETHTARPLPIGHTPTPRLNKEGTD